MLRLSYVLVLLSMIAITRPDDENSSMISNLSDRNRTYMYVLKII